MKRIMLLSGLLLLFLCCAPGKADSLFDNWQVVHNDLSLDVRDFENKTISGAAVITLKSKQNNASDISLLLLKMEIDSVLLNGQPVKGYTYDSLRISVPLKTPAKKEEEVKLRIVYHGQPEASDYGGFKFGDNFGMAHNMGSSFTEIPHSFGRSWFPAADDYRSRSTFDLHIKVDSSLKGIGSGILVDTIPGGDGATVWHWRVNQPVPDYLVSVAVGNYEKISYTYEQSGRTLPIDIYVFPGEVEQAKEMYANLTDILAVFEDRLGEYAFDRVGFVSVDGRGGAMEHVGNIAMPLIGLVPFAMYRDVMIHELAHGWFGNLVTCASEGDMWLNEGFATFCPMFINEALFPDVDIIDYRQNMQMIAWLGIAYEEDFYAMKDMPAEHTFSATNYYKGGMVVQTLREMLGNDAFFSLMREYLETYAFRHVTTDEFRKFVTDRFPDKPLDDFFDWAVYRPGFLAFEIDSLKGDMIAEDQFQGHVYLEQKLWGAPEYGQNVRVPVTFFDASGEWKEKKYVKASGRFTSYPVDLPFRPAYGVVDMDYELCKASLCDRIEVDSVGLFARPYNQINLECTSLEAPFALNLENFKVPADDPSDTIRAIGSGYWRITGVIPEKTGLRGLFNQNSSSLLSSGKKLLMMYRESPSSAWETLFEIPEEVHKDGIITVENLRAGEYCIGMEE